MHPPRDPMKPAKKQKKIMNPIPTLYRPYTDPIRTHPDPIRTYTDFIPKLWAQTPGSMQHSVGGRPHENKSFPDKIRIAILF